MFFCINVEYHKIAATEMNVVGAGGCCLMFVIRSPVLKVFGNTVAASLGNLTYSKRNSRGFMKNGDHALIDL